MEVMSFPYPSTVWKWCVNGSVKNLEKFLTQKYIDYAALFIERYIGYDRLFAISQKETKTEEQKLRKKTKGVASIID